MRWLDSIIHSMDMSLNKLQEMWRTEPGVLQALGPQRVGHDLVTEQQLTPSLVAAGSSHPMPLWWDLPSLFNALWLPPLLLAKENFLLVKGSGQHGSSLYLNGPPDLAMAAKTRYCRLSGLNSRHLFFRVLEAKSPRSRCWQIRFLGKTCFLACRQLPSCYILIQWTKEALVFLPLLTEAPVPSRGLHPHITSKPNHLPRPHLLIRSYSRLGFQYMNLAVQGSVNTQVITDL